MPPTRAARVKKLLRAIAEATALRGTIDDLDACVADLADHQRALHTRRMREARKRLASQIVLAGAELAAIQDASSMRKVERTYPWLKPALARFAAIVGREENVM